MGRTDGGRPLFHCEKWCVNCERLFRQRSREARMKVSLKRLSVLSVALVLGAALVACGGGSSKTKSTATTTGGKNVSISVTAFTSDFAAMSQLKGLAGQGKGLVGVLLPDTTSSARYVSFDAPYLTKAFQTAGFTQFKVDNAQGSASTMQTQAEADITSGASVLIVDPLDSGSGAAIENNAISKGVQVIDYDRLTKGGPADRIYVSFDNVKVGQTIGKGF